MLDCKHEYKAILTFLNDGKHSAMHALMNTE
jgi:hypothetical protein